MKIKR